MGLSVCPECDGTRRVEEGCCCYQCEYDDSAHRRLVPCLSCSEGVGQSGGRTEYRVRHVDLSVGGYPIDKLTTHWNEAMAEARALRRIESVTEVWIEKREMTPWQPTQQTEFPRPKEMGHGW